MDGEQLAVIRKSVREFADEVVRPYAAKIDEENAVPPELVKRVAEMGYFSLRVPEKYGGPGLSLTESVVVIEELSRASSAIGIMATVSGSMVVYPIVEYGSEELKSEYLTRLAEGEIGAFALTEPCCGSDAASITTRARRVGNYYEISGEKIFITNAPYASFFVVAARTGRQEEGKRGISLFVVDRDDCVSVSKLNMMGYRGSGTSIVKFNDCRVHRDKMIGEENRGFKKVMMTLNEGRVTTSATGIGIMSAAFEEALRYSQERTSMGRRLVEHQMVQYMISEMATLLEASRLLVYKAASKLDRRERDAPLYASMAKLFTAKSGV
ncbi:MAG: acyl-CoA dehydrogenase family protein, partial [Desulfurococcales archaeon]|nr:acyl-CoA dehydrogenase family protein [Desulfurococcales archaeon]